MSREPARATSAIAETRTSGNSRGFGIRTRLFLAFGAVAALTVLASLVAFLSYNRVGDTLAAITERNMPAMSLPLRRLPPRPTRRRTTRRPPCSTLS